MTHRIALEIKTPEDAVLVKLMRPDLEGLNDQTDLIGKFLVFGHFEPDGTCLFEPAEIGELFDHVENGPQIRLKLLID